MPAFQCLLALFVLWLTFYGVGRALMLVPSQFHQIESEDGEDTASDESNNTVPNLLDRPRGTRGTR